ncbi:MAG: sensor histidine kinase [Bacteroidota bacterium]
MKFHLIVVVLCFFAITAQGQTTKVPTNKSYTEEFDQLLAKRKRYSDNADSLKSISNDFTALYKRYHDPQSMVYATYNMADYYYLRADHINAMRDYVKALNLAQKFKIEKVLPHIYSNIGNLHKENTNYPMAFEATEKGLEVARNLRDTTTIIAMLGQYAMFKRSYLKHFNKPLKSDTTSINMQFEGLKMAESSPKYELQRIPYYDNIAQHYKDIGIYDLAIIYANKGVALATKLGRKRSLTYGYNWLGEAQYFSGQRSLGISNVKKALDLSISIKQPYRTMELYEAMANCYKSSGNYKDAYGYIEKWIALRDSLNVQDNEKQIGELQIKYETAKKDKDLAVSDQRVKDRNKLLNYSFCGLLVFLALLVFLVYLYDVIKHKNKILTDNNAKINDQSAKLLVLMQELHHRVKNNLQIVSSLLTLQSNRMADDDARQALDVSRQRIEAMSIIHSSLYQQDAANKVDMTAFLPELLRSILESFGIENNKIALQTTINVNDIDVDIAIPLGLIMNEWITNVFKHAYKDPNVFPSLTININQQEKVIFIEIIDNGIGIPINSWDNPKDSFGIKLIKILIKQINGIPSIVVANGTKFNLEIPNVAVIPVN